MAHFFKNALMGFLSDPAEEDSEPVCLPETGQEESEEHDHRGVGEAAEAKVQERGNLGGRTEVLAETNFRTIVRNYPFSENCNGGNVLTGAWER